jgi:hypothetical protein
MGLFVKSTTLRGRARPANLAGGQARQLNSFGRGMSRMRMWGSAHPRLRKLEYVPFVGAGALAVVDQFAHVFLTSGEAGYLAGGLLLANIVFRSATYYARRIDLEGKTDQIDSLSREEQLKYCCAILRERDIKIQKKSKIAAVEALGKIGPDAISMLEEALGYSDVVPKPTLSPSWIPALDKKLEHWDNDVRQAAAKVLGKVGPEAIPVLGRVLEHWNSEVRYAAVLTEREGVPVWRLERWDNDDVVMYAVAEALGELGPAAIPALEKGLLRGYLPAAKLLSKFGHPAVDALGKALESDEDGVGIVAADALGEIGGPAAVSALGKAQKNSESSVVRKAAEAALERIKSRTTE